MIVKINENKFSNFLDKIINDYITYSDIIEVYTKLRHSFQREGWSQKDLENPPYYPTDIMQNHQKFSFLKNELIKNLTSILNNRVDEGLINDYLIERLKQIDLETPLKNGNIKRNNSRDENN
jgi:hypothetical protein